MMVEKVFTQKLTRKQSDKTKVDLELIRILTTVGKKLGSRVIIHGGYAVDGALGQITRYHKDIDVQIYAQSSDAIGFVKKLLETAAEQSKRFGSFSIEDKSQNQYYRNLYVKIGGTIADIYFLQTKNQPFGRSKILVKKDGTYTEPQVYGTKYFKLNQIRFEAQAPLTELTDKIFKREHRGDPKLKRHRQDIENLKKIVAPKAIYNGLIKKAVEILKQGGIVVYPTDTAYGLAADATKLAALKKLYRLKGRDFRKPVHVIPPSDSIRTFVRTSPLAKKLMQKFMPGPLTIVLPLSAKGKSWQMLSAGTRTLGIRRPKNKLALDLASLLGRPITTTSANVSGGYNTYSIAEVKKQFARSRIKPDFYLDGGKLKKSKPSTIVSIISRRVRILREGPITEKEIRKVIKG